MVRCLLSPNVVANNVILIIAYVSAYTCWISTASAKNLMKVGTRLQGHPAVYQHKVGTKRLDSRNSILRFASL